MNRSIFRVLSNGKSVAARFRRSCFSSCCALLIGATGSAAFGQYFSADVAPQVTWIGSATSQGDAVTNADAARANFGVDGSGIKIGLISDSFNTTGSSPTLPGQTSAGDLPGAGNPNGYLTPITVVQDLAGGTDEARAIFEIVHDLAPGAELFFHSAFSNVGGGSAPSQSIANAIDSLVAQNVDIILDDAGILTGARFQDGAAAQAVDAAKAAGVAYFSAAGNSARDATRHAFNGPVGSTVNFGTNDVLELNFPGGTRPIIIQWTEPYPSVSGAFATADFEVDVTSADGTATFFTIDANAAGDDPYEFFGINGPAGPLGLRIRHKSGATDLQVQASVFSGTAITDVDDTDTGTVYGHAAAAGAVAVAAHRQSNLNNVEFFSSRGPTDIFFDAAGNPVDETRQTPLLTGPDGVTTTTDGFGFFLGTSAAVPHVAAIAALALQRADDTGQPLTVDELYDLLFDSAIDMESPGFDNLTGHGRLDALAVLRSIVPEPSGLLLLTVAMSAAMLLRR
ncbi:S8 family serine peptidase [Pirellulales bacterium]|nr:S8 family serine peptidase [Pirellulales bacterium]